MIRQKPALRYCGVTIELEYPGRFDTKELIAGPSAYLLSEALGPLKLNRYAFDIRTKDCKEPYCDGTRVIVACGATSLSKVGFPHTRINTLRGTPFTSSVCETLHDGLVYIPTYHPQDATDRKGYELTLNPYAAAALGIDDGDSSNEDDDGDEDVKDMGKTARRNYKFWFIQDITKAVDIARNGYRPNRATYHTSLSIHEILGHLRRAGAGTESSTLYFDIETERTTGRITCFGFSYDAKDIYVVPIIDYRGQSVWRLETSAEIFLALAYAFSRCTVVAHNGSFDLFMTTWRYKIPPPLQDKIYDTMLAQARMHVDVEKSLGHCISQYTHQPYHKDEGFAYPTNITQYERFLLYNAKDVEGTALIHQRQLELLKADPGLAASVEQANALVRPLLLKSLRGLKLDTEKLCKKIDELNSRAGWLIQNVLCKLAGEHINPRSPQKVAELLYTKFNLPKPTDPNISLTGKGTLYKLALKYPIPTLPVIHHTRRCLREAGHLSAKLWRDSHTTCFYAITGTKTFRLSSRKLLSVFGTNLQNWSKKMRALVIAGSGYKLIQVDQSGAEALIVAYIAPTGRYRDLFIHKVSPHVYFGLYAFPQVWKAELGYDITYLYDYSIAECKADKRWSEISKCIKATDNNPSATRYYYFQKQINHSSNYDITAPQFALNLLEKSEGEVSLPVSECDRLLGIYHTLYPEIRGGFHAYVKQQLQTRVLRNMFGYPRHFYGMVDDKSVIKDAYSWIPQSTVGCITGKADCDLQLRIDRKELDFLEVWQNNHDSLLARCREEDVKRTAEVMQKAMNIQMTNHRGEVFSMRSEASVGDNWYEMEELK